MVLGLMLTTGVVAVSAQDEKSEFFGIANRVGVGVGVGTEGIGFDVAVPLTKYVQARLGLNVMPNININTTADVSGEFNGNSITETMDVKGKFSRTTFDVKFDCYPFANSSSFFVTAGFSVGGDKLVKITGHSDRLQQYIAAGNSYNVEIGDYQIPVDRNGDVNGGIKVNNFRPYLTLASASAVLCRRSVLVPASSLEHSFRASPWFMPTVLATSPRCWTKMPTTTSPSSWIGSRSILC